MASHSNKPLVYVVDDDDAVRDSLDTYLTLKGMRVTVFSSAQEVLNHHDMMPNLLILDVNMPNIDGFVLLEMLRERGHVEPAVLITGLGDPETRARAESAGVAAHPQDHVGEHDCSTEREEALHGLLALTGQPIGERIDQ